MDLAKLIGSPTGQSAAGPTRLDPQICVIGAGCSGLVTLKLLREAGLPCTAFEIGSDVGGLWDQQNTNGRSAAYDSLRINTSSRAMAFSDFPMPASAGDYPMHHQVAEYFRAYADTFQLREAIQFETEVTRVAPAPGGGYWVSIRSRDGLETTLPFSAVVVASGHHFSPAWPKPFPAGDFTGIRIHSHAYKSIDVPVELRGKRVVVVGMGNSAMDIAVELASAGAPVRLSYRRGVWVIPRYLFGKPVDQGTLIPHFLPEKLRRRIVTLAFQRLVGKMSDFGLPEPDHLIGEAHPTLSSELPGLVRSGAIQMRRQIERTEGLMVHFEGGVSEEADCLIYCTGYDICFPFLDPTHVAIEGNHLPLFLRIFHPEHRRLFFIGLAQPHGAIMPIAEQQAALLALHLRGEYNLPDDQELTAQLQREAAWLRRRYVASRRHTMQVEPEAYLSELRRERRRGAQRARRLVGQPFPGSWRTDPSGASA